MGEQQPKGNEKNLCFKGWETLANNFNSLHINLFKRYYLACFQIYLSCQFDFGLYYKLLNFIFRLIFSKIFVFLTTYNVGTISLSSYIVTLSLIFSANIANSSKL